jgi:putative membrane protein
MTEAAATAFVAWQPRPAVWLLVASVVALGLYATRVVGPNAVRDGEPVTTVRQRVFFWAGVAVLWLASDWPVHDIAEGHLYSVHMVQHFVLTFVMPPLFLLATPTWLARLVIGQGETRTWLRRLARPVAAGVIFNAVIIVTHRPDLVNHSVEVGPLHYAIHLVVGAAAFLMWLPVGGPIPEWRISMPGQMVYLFLMSIVPTVPAAWLTLADNPVYEAYDHGHRLWGITVVNDQQMAGLFMKLGGGIYLWMIIAYLFFSWATRNQRADRENRYVTERELLTWDQVSEEFDRLGPAPVEPDVTIPDGPGDRRPPDHRG